jgi:hypothetical protein
VAKSAVSLTSTKPITNGALKSADLPSRLKILNWGENPTIDGKPLIFDDESSKVFYANQRAIGRTQAPVDFNHNTVKGTQAYNDDKEPRAIAANAIPTIVPGDGLYMEYVGWTPSGEKSARDFCDLSPAVFTDGNNRVVALHSVGLTPAGAVEGLSFYTADGPKSYSADSLAEVLELCSAKTFSAGKDDHFSEYGDVFYADEKNHKYPINTESHVRAAWSYIHMPKNHKGYSADEVSAIKEKIAAKAKHFGIELKAHSAADKTPVNAYATDPYEGLDKMNADDMEYFRKKLGLDDGAHPDDIMKAIRAKWEGLEPDKEPLPEKTPGSSTDPEKRNHDMDEGKVKTVISYTAADGTEMKVSEKQAVVLKEAQAIADAKIKTFAAESEKKLTTLTAKLDALLAEKDSKIKEIETEQRKSLVAEASRLGKVIPFSDEELAKLPVDMVKTMVAKLTPTVNVGRTVLKPFTPDKDGNIPRIPGARQQAVEAMNSYFAERGVHSGGLPLKPGSN